jgi:hypothetical protein
MRCITAIRRFSARACEARDDALCAACAAGLDRARAYLALGLELGVEVPA